MVCRHDLSVVIYLEPDEPDPPLDQAVDCSNLYGEGQVGSMGFSFSGTGKGGDLAPRKECAEAWRQKILDKLNVELTLIIGQYAQLWHMEMKKKLSVAEVVRQWRSYAPNQIPLPHPSPRNNIWLKKNPWFGAELLPELRMLVKGLLV